MKSLVLFLDNLARINKLVLRVFICLCGACSWFNQHIYERWLLVLIDFILFQRGPGQYNNHETTTFTNEKKPMSLRGYVLGARTAKKEAYQIRVILGYLKL